MEKDNREESSKIILKNSLYGVFANEMTPEEIRIRSMVSMRTGEMHLCDKIPKMLQVYGLYPEIIGVDECKTQEFRDKIKQWPDVKAAVVKHGLSIKYEYVLCQYAKMIDGVRFVAEMIQNENGSVILGTLAPASAIIDLTTVCMQANIEKKSHGLCINNIRFTDHWTGGLTAEELLWQDVVEFRPMFVGTINKTHKIVQDCKITGFYLKQKPSLPDESEL